MLNITFPAAFIVDVPPDSYMSLNFVAKKYHIWRIFSENTTSLAPYAWNPSEQKTFIITSNSESYQHIWPYANNKLQANDIRNTAAGYIMLIGDQMYYVSNRTFEKFCEEYNSYIKILSCIT